MPSRTKQIDTSATKYRKVSVSFPPKLIADARAYAKRIGYRTSFSQYVQDLVERDMNSGMKRTKGKEPERN